MSKVLFYQLFAISVLACSLQLRAMDYRGNEILKHTIPITVSIHGLNSQNRPVAISSIFHIHPKTTFFSLQYEVRERFASTNIFKDLSIENQKLFYQDEQQEAVAIASNNSYIYNVIQEENKSVRIIKIKLNTGNNIK